MIMSCSGTSLFACIGEGVLCSGLGILRVKLPSGDKLVCVCCFWVCTACVCCTLDCLEFQCVCLNACAHECSCVCPHCNLNLLEMQCARVCACVCTHCSFQVPSEFWCIPSELHSHGRGSRRHWERDTLSNKDWEERNTENLRCMKRFFLKNMVL